MRQTGSRLWLLSGCKQRLSWMFLHTQGNVGGDHISSCCDHLVCPEVRSLYLKAQVGQTRRLQNQQFCSGSEGQCLESRSWHYISKNLCSSVNHLHNAKIFVRLFHTERLLNWLLPYICRLLYS